MKRLLSCAALCLAFSTAHADTIPAPAAPAATESVDNSPAYLVRILQSQRDDLQNTLARVLAERESLVKQIGDLQKENADLKAKLPAEAPADKPKEPAKK